MRTRVKICGITRIEDAQAAVAAGADAIGLVFAEASPRCVTPKQARTLADALPPFITVVGLFVDMPAARVRDILGQVPLNLLQFHGNEAPQDCQQFGRPYIRAIRMAPGVDLAVEARHYEQAAGLLLDAYHPQVAGGTGETFDWARVPRNLNKPVILAGGLTPENVGRAIQTVRPYAVDVSSGVEQSKGIKDVTKIAAFIRAVEEGSASQH